MHLLTEIDDNEDAFDFELDKKWLKLKILVKPKAKSINESCMIMNVVTSS